MHQQWGEDQLRVLNAAVRGLAEGGKLLDVCDLQVRTTMTRTIIRSCGCCARTIRQDGFAGCLRSFGSR